MLRPPTILAIGFSHLGAIVRAYQARAVVQANTSELQFINFNISERHRPLFVTHDGKVMYNQAIIEDVQCSINTGRPALIVGSLWSNQHFAISTFNDPRPFDFIIPDESERPLLKSAEIVPYDLIYLFMSQRCKHFYGIAPLFKSSSKLPFFIVSAPPPVAELSEIRGGSPTAAIAAKVKELGMAPAELRYKAWKVCEMTFRNWSEGDGIPFLRVPPEAVDADGFRKREYFGSDWIHASDSYGELVLRQIDSVLAKGSAQ
jgi:hypothetical protein